MDPFGLVDVGRTGLKVTRLGLGGTPLGNAPPVIVGPGGDRHNP